MRGCGARGCEGALAACAEHARWFPHDTAGVWPEARCGHVKCGLAVARGAERGALVSGCGCAKAKAPKKRGPQLVRPVFMEPPKVGRCRLTL